MVGPRRGEQQRLGLRRSTILLAGQQQLADLLRAFAAARLARDDQVDSPPLQRLGQRGDLGRLADPLPAFEGDEAPRALTPCRAIA